MVLLLFLLLAAGVSGYMFIEGYTFQQAFYMTIITLSTVGFSEVRQLTGPGQWFTSILIITSFGIFAYGLTQLAQAVFSGELIYHLKQRKLKHKIDALENHVVVCGYGRNGRRAVQKLLAYGESVVVIERNEEIIKEFLEGKKLLFVEGDATSDTVLEDAGIERAKALVSTLSKDADNLFVMISARALDRDIKLISRASHPNTVKKLKAVGANAVVMPEGVGGAHMASLVVNPNVVEFLERISVEGSSNINLEEVALSELTGSQQSCTLADLQIRKKTGCTVIGLMSPNGDYEINPDGDFTLEPQSKLFVLGRKEQIAQLGNYLNGIKKDLLT